MGCTRCGFRHFYLEVRPEGDFKRCMMCNNKLKEVPRPEKPPVPIGVWIDEAAEIQPGRWQKVRNFLDD